MKAFDWLMSAWVAGSSTGIAVRSASFHNHLQHHFTIIFWKTSYSSKSHISSPSSFLLTMKDDELVRVVRTSLPTEAAAVVERSSLRFTSLARLWSGMGYLYRVDLVDSSSAASPYFPRVVKQIRLPSSLSSLGDRRKADSYQVEANFFEHVVPQLRNEYNVQVPETYHVERSKKTISIVMSYVPAAGGGSLHTKNTRLVLSWLAQFHAATLGRAAQLVQDYGLQPRATYWYLATRPDEYAALGSRGLEGRLKRAAKAIDERLQADAAQCLVHGDVKEANLLFHADATDGLTLCDFQYCGQGTPAQDLAYFFCSSLDGLEDQEEHLAFYLAALTRHVPDQAVASVPTLAALRDSLEWAYCDWYRFMAGWGFWGNDIGGCVRSKLNELDDGQDLGSEEAYCAAMQQRFG
jgi:hypothetical protein